MNPHFFITFGLKYADTPHPSGRHANPQGYVEVIAPDEDAARRMADYLFGAGLWANIYTDSTFRFELYPLGALSATCIAGDEPEPVEPILITDAGTILLLPDVSPMTPGVANALAVALQDAAQRAVRQRADAAAAAQRIADVEVKRHADMF